MTGYRTRRLATVVSSALIGLLLLSSTAVTAGTPAGWSINAIALPSNVTPGQDAGYQVNIGNAGPSNISQLFLVDDGKTAPSYVHTSHGSCTDAGVSPLLCTFGALNAGGSITVIVAYTTPTTGTTFSVNFELNTTGATFTNPAKSHGTVLPATGTTTLSTDPDYGGGFIVGDSTVADAQIGGHNIQSTLVVSPSTLIPVTVQDGSGTAGNAECPADSHAFADCSLVSVGGGHLFDHPFLVVLTFLGSALPSAVNANNLTVLHTYTDADGNLATETISARCTSEPPASSGAPCLVVTKVGKNLQVDIWLLRNGGVHATY